jgi:hypothetical protein
MMGIVFLMLIYDMLKAVALFIYNKLKSLSGKKNKKDAS